MAIGCSKVGAEKASAKNGKVNQWKNSLSPQDGRSIKLTLTDNGSAAFKILLPNNNP